MISEEILNQILAAGGKSHSLEGTAMAVPKHFNVVDVEKHLPFPKAKRGHIEARSLKSLIDYAADHCVPRHSVVFACSESLQIIATLDWHQMGEDAEAGSAVIDPAPRWGKHTVSYQLKETREIRAWRDISGRALTQPQFAEFIEEHTDDIVTPAPLDLLSQINKLSGKRSTTFELGRRLDNGDVSIEWKEDTHTNNGNFPTGFVIQIPVFKGAEAATSYEVKALLRYRINEGKLSFEVKLLHLEKIRDLAFDRLSETLQQECNALGIAFYTGAIIKNP